MEITDAKFEQITLKQGYLGYEELENCKQIQQRTAGEPLYKIAIKRDFITPKELEIICDIAENKKLTFGGYEVKSILGEGGLGVVYLAKQLSMKRNVALKVLYPRWVKDEEFRKRFLLEARIVGKLSHPNLIQVFDIGFDKGRYFFSMEYVAGRTIDEIITHSGAFDLKYAIDITLQILDSLNYIWGRKLVHRDIKPSNVIITSKKVAKLGDFGFVKCHMENQLSSEDFVLGTPDYMSPEQAMGREDLDFRSDIYSLGATLYHMLTASAPFKGSESMVIRQHIKASIPSPIAIDPELPESICFIIEKMMAKAPQDRYAKYEELKRDLLLVKEGNIPKLQRLESSKSTIAPMEMITNHPASQIFKLKKQLKKLRQRERYYQVIILLFVGFIGILLLNLWTS